MFQLSKAFAKAKIGSIHTVDGFIDQHIASKLLSIGILPGSTLQVIRSAPGSYVYYVKVDGVIVALRRNELNAIVLKS